MKRYLLALIFTGTFGLFAWAMGPSEPGGPVAVGTQFSYQPGTQLNYQLNTTVTTRLSYERDGQRGEDTYTMRVMGDVQLDVVTNNPQQGATLSLRLVNPSVTYTSNNPAKQMIAAQGQEINESFDVDTVMIQAEDGHITSFAVDPNALPDVNDLLRGISSTLQMTLDGATHYFSQETTVSGIQVVEYSHLGNILPKAPIGSGPNGTSPYSSIQRVIQSVQQYADPNVNLQKTQTSGNRMISFNNEEGVIESVDYHETVRSVDGSFESQTFGSLTKIGSGTSLPNKAHDWDARIARLIPTSLMGQPRLLDSQEPASIEEIASLASALRQAQNASQASSLMLRLSKSLKNNPNGNYWILQELRARRFNQDQLRYVIGALGSSGEATAQMGLLGLSQDGNQSLQTRKRALVAMGLTRNPHPQVLRYFFNHLRAGLQGKTESSWTQHALLLGAMVHRAGDQAITQRYTSFMEEALSKDASSAKTRRILVKSLGNAGQLEVLPLLETFIHHDQDTLRADAVYALRKMPFKHTKELVMQDALWDASPLVRIAALRALEEQPFNQEIDQDLSSLANREPDAKVQTTLVRIVRNRLESLPSGKRILRTVHHKTESIELRKTIDSALGSDLE